MPVYGRGQRRVLLVSDYPGRDEDRFGRPFAGRSGDLLKQTLEGIGVDLERDCWTMNALSCYSPTASEHKTAVTDCRPNVLAAIRKYDPETIVLAGTSAVKSVIGTMWKEKTGTVKRWVGWRVPGHKPNAWVCPVYNPASLLYDDVDPVMKLEFRQHLRDAFACRGRPWPDGPPDYAKRVTVMLDPNEAARHIDRYTAGTIAYDFETTCSKPDGPGSEIVCCSVCHNGTETIAFPWLGKVRGAMIELLTDGSVRKIAANLDMEDRWTRKHLGIEVSGWYWDTMLAAHGLDPRGDEDRKSSDGITGLKFQAFARLGQPEYNHHIEPFLVPDRKGGYSLNRINEIGLPLLLKYCGMDSVLEFEVARSQIADAGLIFEE